MTMLPGYSQGSIARRALSVNQNFALSTQQCSSATAEATVDDVVTQEEVDVIEVYAAQAIDEIVEQIARGQIPQAKANLGNLKVSLR